MKLLVIADDFTGAVDTGAQFKAKDVLIRVGDEQALLPGTDRQVLILDAETRHMGAEEAYQTIYRIVSRAVELGILCIYKKTDSGLRGPGRPGAAGIGRHFRRRPYPGRIQRRLRPRAGRGHPPGGRFGKGVTNGF